MNDAPDLGPTTRSPPPRPRRKGIYILPNLFTLAALFGGFYAIVMAMNGRFEQAAIGIFCAMVLDSLDGRVARMTNTQSAFGEQMDSLSDMVSFGAAPALIVYEWALKGLGKLGLDRRLRLLRRRGAAAGALQHQHRRRRQALLPGPAQPGGGGAGDGLHLADGRHRLQGLPRGAWLGWMAFGFTLYRRPDDGDQRAVLQLQGRELQALGALHRDRRDRAGHSRSSPSTRRPCCSRCSCVYGLSGYAVYVWTARPRAGRSA